MYYEIYNAELLAIIEHSRISATTWKITNTRC